MSSEISIEVDGLSKCYRIYNQPYDRLLQMIDWRKHRRYYREFWALHNVSFQIKRGETVGIIGRNGSGKSTLLQIIAETLSATNGSVQSYGRIAALLELGAGFNPDFTGRENIYLNAAIYGLNRDEIDLRILDIIEFADIGDFLDQPVKTYSTGMSMRLAFAVSVNIDAEILIVDEALAVGDMAFQQKCFEHLADLQTKGVTILLVSHDILMCRNYCDALIYLESGKIKSIGSPELIGEEYIRDMLGAQNMPAITEAEAGETSLNLGSIRFGTKGGKFTEISVANGLGGLSNLNGKERLQITVKGEMSENLINPDVVIQVRDFRGYIIYGVGTVGEQLIRVNKAGAIEFRATLELSLSLAPGTYSIAASLNDRTSSTTFRLIDKLVGVCEFTILKTNQKNIHGCIDLGGIWLSA